MTKHEVEFWKKARRAATWLQIAPFVRFVAVTGSLSRGEAKPDSDADLFVVTEPGHLYTARAFALILLQYTGQRVNVEAGRIGGAVDPNYWLSSDHLDIQPHTAFVARDYTYMMPLWDSSDVYFRLMHMNPWVAEYKRKFRDVMPPHQYSVLRVIQLGVESLYRIFGSWLERWTRSVQERRVRAFADRQGRADHVVLTDSELRLHF